MQDALITVIWFMVCSNIYFYTKLMKANKAKLLDKKIIFLLHLFI